MRNNVMKILTGAAATCALISSPVLAEKADQLVDINGEGANDAESSLMKRGFSFISSHNSASGYTTSYWWDERDDDCVMVEVANRRVLTITDAKDQDCGHHKGSDAGTAVAVVAGAALIGALFSHKSHHRGDRDYDQNQSREFERGYQDGLHNAAYHNRSGDQSYAQGYTAGHDEREGNLRHHHGHAGYTQTAEFMDLKGARARGAMSDLENRGFRQVDNFTSGDTRYSIQWRQQSRQCLQVTIADGSFYDIRDIRQHPKCR